MFNCKDAKTAQDRETTNISTPCRLKHAETAQEEQVHYLPPMTRMLGASWTKLYRRWWRHRLARARSNTFLMSINSTPDASGSTEGSLSDDTGQSTTASTEGSLSDDTGQSTTAFIKDVMSQFHNTMGEPYTEIATQACFDKCIAFLANIIAVRSAEIAAHDAESAALDAESAAHDTKSAAYDTILGHVGAHDTIFNELLIQFGKLKTEMEEEEHTYSRGSTEGSLTDDTGQSTTVPPAVVVSQRVAIVQHGRTVELRCDVTGDPAPTVRWSRQSGEMPDQIISQGGILTIYNVQQADEGRYMCTATSNAGRARDYSYLWVSNSREIRPGTDPEIVNVGQRVSMEATGKTFPVLTWTRDDGPLPADVFLGDGILIIPQAKVEDAGTYTCTGVNEAGSITSKLVLVVREMAEATDSHDQMTRDSRRLYSLCCKAGFSEYNWRKRLQESDAKTTIHGYIGMLSENVRFTTVCSGSASEGVAMGVIGSDIDTMFVLSGTHVIEDGDISSDESDNVFKMISTTHPAFVNTELRHRSNTADSSVIDTPKYCDLDDTGRHLLNSERLKLSLMKDECMHHGPAFTSTDMTLDFVYCLHCKSWPSVSREWIYRPREYNWPTPEQIKEIVDNGCELVCLGAPNSASPQFDFRLSSSMAEQILVRSFNIFQLQCYFLLKVILKFRIKPFFPIETLCSYHMKTVMLYVVETTNPVVWRKDNLVHCLMICLKKLQSFLRDGHCPQYFIPQQNLFEQKVKPQLKEVMEIVNDIVAFGWRCVLRCPPFNNAKLGHLQRNSMDHLHLQCLRYFTLKVYIDINGICDGSLQSCIGSLQHVCSIKAEQESKQFPCKDTALIIRSLFKSTIGLSLLNMLTRRQDMDHVERPVLQYAKQCMESACESSIVSCRLKYALFLYVNKETERCVDLVKEYVTTHINRDVVPLCEYLARETGLKHGDFSKFVMFDVHDVRGAYIHLLPIVNLSKWEVKACPLIIQNVTEIRKLVTSLDHKFPSALMIDNAVCAYLLLVLAYTDIGRCRESRQYLELLRQCVEIPDQFFILFPESARRILDQCQQYVSSGNQQDLSASN